MRRFRLFLALVLAAMWFYHDSLFNRTFAMIVAYLTLWIEDGGIDSGSEPIMSEGVVPQEATVDAGHISGGESP